MLKVIAGKRKNQESNPGLSDSKALLPNHFALTLQWQRLAQSLSDSQNTNWQGHSDRSHVCRASLGAEITMATESISTLANVFTLVDRNLLEFQSF